MSGHNPEQVTIDFCAISLSNRIAIQSDGTEHRIIEMWDDAGQDTDDEDEAAFLIVEIGSGQLACISMNEFEDAPLN